MNGEDVGYVPRNDAAELAPQMDAGKQVRAEVDWLNAPSDDIQRFGLKVRVGLLKDDVSGNESPLGDTFWGL